MHYHRRNGHGNHMRHFLGMTLGLLCMVALADLTRAQTPTDRQQTKQRLEALREQIAEQEKQLSQTAQREQASLKQLENVERKIAIRKELLENYRRRKVQLNQSVDSIRTSMTDLESQIERLRKQYQQRAQRAYKHGRLNDLALILAARSINQMLVRVQYLRRFADERREKLASVRQVTDTLEARRRELQEMRAEVEQLIQETEEERENLVQLQASRRAVIQDLRNQREAIQSALTRKRTSASRLEERMQQLMAESTRETEATADPAVRAEYEALSGSFAKNEGNLPWPVQGVVTEPFGQIVNPVYGTKTPNPGLLISTKPSAPVHSIFRGEVYSIFKMPDFGTCAAVRHGEFSSVYCNFSMLYVGEGEQVKAGQVLGRAGTESEPRGSGLFFSLFKSGVQDPLNPTPWLRNR